MDAAIITNVIIYVLLFIMGTLFGSFCTLGVYRIPKRQDITHTHSYCPNCNHKLGFLDLIPVFSYLFLRGKCRYCKEKIRPRYVIIEALSGFLFVAIALAMKIDIYSITTQKIVQYAFMVLYLIFIILISGIDYENRKIDKAVSIYGIAISICYMIYLCIVEQANIYRYGIYLVFYIIVLILDTVTLKRYAKNSYTSGVLFMVITMAIFTGEYVTANAIIYTLLCTSFYLLFHKLKIKKHRRKKADDIQWSKKVSMGFFLGTFNVLMLLLVLGISNYRI